MRLSAKTQYACVAMMELAARYGSGEPVRIRSIAEDHGIPARFLVQILLQLKGAGLVQSTRGASGGYELCVAPDEVSLGQVIQVIEGREDPATGAGLTDSPASRVLNAHWREAAEAQWASLDALSFATLVEEAMTASENMYYI